MNPLASRKQLLIAESELNRAHLIQTWQTMTGEVHSLARQAKTIKSIGLATVSLVTGLASYRHKNTTPVAEKPAWWGIILKSAGLIFNFWQASSSRRHD